MNNTNLQHWLVRFLEAYIDLESFFDPLIDSHIASSPTFTKVLSVRKCVALFWLPHRGSFVDMSNFTNLMTR